MFWFWSALPSMWSGRWFIFSFQDKILFCSGSSDRTSQGAPKTENICDEERRQNSKQSRLRTSAYSERLLYTGWNDVILQGDEMSTILTSLPFSVSLFSRIKSIFTDDVVYSSFTRASGEIRNAGMFMSPGHGTEQRIKIGVECRGQY